MNTTTDDRYWGACRLVNLTSHEVRLTEPTIETAQAVCMVIPPEPVSARLETRREVVGWLNPAHPAANPPAGLENHWAQRGWQIPVVRTTWGAVTGLPEPAEGVLLIVSRLVADAVPERRDLVVPDDIVRGPDGQPMYARALSLASAPA